MLLMLTLQQSMSCTIISKQFQGCDSPLTVTGHCAGWMSQILDCQVNMIWTGNNHKAVQWIWATRVKAHTVCDCRGM